MSMHIRKQFIDFFENSETGFVLVEKDKILYINQAACNVFGCDNGQQSLINIMSSDIMKRFLNGHDNKFENIEINGNPYNINIIFGDDELYIFIRGITEYESAKFELEYKSRCILAITQHQKEIIDNIATILMGDVEDPELYKLMVKNVYRRMYKSNAALTEISKSMFSKCENKGCHNVNYLIQQVLTNIKSLFPDIIVKYENSKKNMEVYCDSVSIQNAIYSIFSAFMYPDKKTGDFCVECANFKNKVIITITCRGVVWGGEQRSFVNKERPELLLVDIHRFGYDMMRVENIMDWHEGSIDVKVMGNSTLVSLLLDNKNVNNGELVMNSGDCEQLSLEDAEIIFSDIM